MTQRYLLVCILYFLFSLQQTEATDPLDEGFNQTFNKSKSASIQNEINKAHADRKMLIHLINQAKILSSPDESESEIYTTKSELTFRSFLARKGQYLIINQSLFFRDWQFRFHDKLSNKFLGNVGLHASIESLAFEIYKHEDFQKIIRDNKRMAISRPFILIGSGLGGAVAIILAKKLQNLGHEILEVTTFGQPKITDASGAQELNDLPILRVTLDSDILSRLPVSNLTYNHVGRNLKLNESKYLLFPDSKHDSIESFFTTDPNQLEQLVVVQSEIYLSAKLEGLILDKSKLKQLNKLVTDSSVISQSALAYISVMERHRVLLDKFQNEKLDFPGLRVGSGTR